MRRPLLILTLALLFINVLHSQCENGRYRNQLFPVVTTNSDIVYGQNLTYDGQTQDLLLDVYKPSGDIQTSRPLVIFAHGGYFVGGDKADESVKPICEELAKMGYVTASIGYRLGIPIQLPLDAPFMEAIMRAVHDMRAAVRFFRKSVDIDGNPYGIDPNEIYVGGVSAGGFISLHLAYLDEDEVPANINTSNPGLGGGLEGNSGNPGYSSEIKGIISIAGAIGDTLWIESGDVPAFLSHGSEDSVVPFGSDTLSLFGLFDVAEVDGSSSIHAKLNDLNIENCFEIYWGQDHVPQQDIEMYFDTTLSIVSNFLSHLICPATPLDCEYRELIAHVSENKIEGELRLYPNPVSGIAHLSGDEGKIINVFDARGSKMDVPFSSNSIDVRGLSSGTYFVEIEKQGIKFTKQLLVY